MKVLVIEDSQTQSKIICKAIRDAGNEVVVEETWGYAVSELAKRPDFVVADWNVPDVESNRIKAVNLLERAKIPFKIFTAFAGQVPSELKKYVLDKATGLSELLAAIATADHSEKNQ